MLHLAGRFHDLDDVVVQLADHACVRRRSFPQYGGRIGYDDVLEAIEVLRKGRVDVGRRKAAGCDELAAVVDDEREDRPNLRVLVERLPYFVELGTAVVAAKAQVDV